MTLVRALHMVGLALCILSAATHIPDGAAVGWITAAFWCAASWKQSER